MNCVTNLMSIDDVLCMSVVIRRVAVGGRSVVIRRAAVGET